ncbi:MAG: FKBP-type peptidyl-prolyl cis-trans isomerase [Clostridia bacterium]|nr:FKBP-type peptidyl-prolyl cis-trans isomerase [Clostridia bacterium]
MKNIRIKALALLLCLAMLGMTLIACNNEPSADSTDGENPLDQDILPDVDPESGDTTGQVAKEVSLEDFDPTVSYPLVNYFDMDMTKYVQLGRYKNLSVSIAAADIAVSDEAVQAEIDAVLSEHHPDARVTDRAAQMGDTVVIDYVGKLDGVAFTGGTALNQTITLSETNGYIPGFVDGMVGLIPGEMKEVPVTFPEDYGKEELNGQAVIFEMTVHYIVGEPVLDDAFVAEFTEGEMSTAEEYTASVRAELEQQAYDSAVRNALWTKIMENAAIIEYPADAVLYYYNYYYILYNQYAAMYGLDYDTFLTYNGMTADYLFSYCKAMVQQDLVRHAVYQDGGYVCSDEEYQALLDEYTAANYESLRASMIASGEEDLTMEQARAYFDQTYANQLKDTCLDGIVTAALKKNLTVTEE